ncbi:hypothetical protein PAESOLCIP111_05550 [Paenibacillus solanacearum]|uniref:Uncharacterized protein n=1 Tax=Paenibacillus solanacearum TaxID=2048548 RepID=A0A916K9G9_9BACL|nr:hypothetical protein PAESOLCIP111_05550 [Paenibacillus solanacearum]
MVTVHLNRHNGRVIDRLGKASSDTQKAPVSDYGTFYVHIVASGGMWGILSSREHREIRAFQSLLQPSYKS